MRDKLPSVVFISIFTILLACLLLFVFTRQGENEVPAMLLSKAERSESPDKPQKLSRAQIFYKCGAVDRRLIDGQYEHSVAYQGLNITLDQALLQAQEEKYTLKGYSNAAARSVDRYLRLEARALLAKNQGIVITDAQLDEEIARRKEEAFSDYRREDTILYLSGGNLSLDELYRYNREEIRKEMAGDRWQLAVTEEFKTERGLKTLSKQNFQDLEWEIENKIAEILKADKVRPVK